MKHVIAWFASQLQQNNLSPCYLFFDGSHIYIAQLRSPQDTLRIYGPGDAAFQLHLILRSVELSLISENIQLNAAQPNPKFTSHEFGDTFSNDGGFI